MDLTLNVERIKIIVLYSSKGHRRISRMIMDKLSSQGNIVLELHPDDEDRIIFKKIDLNLMPGEEVYKVIGMNPLSKIREYILLYSSPYLDIHYIYSSNQE